MDGNPKRIKKDAFSKISGYVWTGPEVSVEKISNRCLYPLPSQFTGEVTFLSVDTVAWCYALHGTKFLTFKKESSPEDDVVV